MAQPTTPPDALLDEDTVTNEPLTVIDEPRLDATPADDEVSEDEDEDEDEDDEDDEADEDDDEDDEDKEEEDDAVSDEA